MSPNIVVKVVDDLTLMKIVGEVSVKDVVETLKNFYLGSPTRYVIWDLSEAPAVPFSAHEADSITTLISSYAKLRPEGKTAIIAPSDLYYGVGRMFDSYTEGKGLNFKTSTFRSYAEAEKWLDIGTLPRL